MVAQAPQLGTYQVLKAYNEIHNGKPIPMAEVIFIGQGWTKFDFKPRKLRLQGLYNKSSIGPKEDFPKHNLQSLYLHMIQIVDKVERPHPDDPSKMQFLLEWDAYKPSNYDELIQQDMEILGDILLQEENEAANAAELQAILNDEIIAMQEVDSELSSIVNDDIIDLENLTLENDDYIEEDEPIDDDEDNKLN